MGRHSMDTWDVASRSHHASDLPPRHETNAATLDSFRSVFVDALDSDHFDRHPGESINAPGVGAHRMDDDVWQRADLPYGMGHVDADV